MKKIIDNAAEFFALSSLLVLPLIGAGIWDALTGGPLY